MKFAATFHHAQNWYMFPTDDQRYDCADAGTTPWVSFGEGPTQREGSGQSRQGSGHFTEKSEPRFTAEDIRFTTKGDAVYAICLGQPGDAITIKALRLFYEDEVAAVSALGVPGDW